MSTAVEGKVQINKRLKGQPREQLQQLSKEQLLDKIEQLQAYNFQLKNLLQKKLSENERKMDEYKCVLQPSDAQETIGNASQTLSEREREHAKKRAFDFSKCHKRHVLLKVLYFGWDYQGFACQEDSNDTIENFLFKALTRTCLIESRATSNYHRCGRTDKEVSAYCQVVSIDLRSKFPSEEQLTPSAIANEIDYCGLLNRIMPKNIQCVAWMPLRNGNYSARFDCIGRTYRYYFPQGDLDISAMREACQLLQRHTDFRNFCKMDVHNGVTNYVRKVERATVERCSGEPDCEGYAMHFLEIKANAFLWHQIRCIMAVLLLIGQHKEEPGVIAELLDVQKHPWYERIACKSANYFNHLAFLCTFSKPQYMPAIGLPLNLYKCEFRCKSGRLPTYAENEMELDEPQVEAETNAELEQADSDTTHWVYNEENLQKLIENVQGEWTQFSVKSTMIRNVLLDLEATLTEQFPGAAKVQSQVLLLQDSVRPRQYQKLLDRKRCESLENRIEHFVKKQRLVIAPKASPSPM